MGLFPWIIVIHVKSIPSTVTPVIVLIIEALRVHVVGVMLVVPFVQRFEYVSQMTKVVSAMSFGTSASSESFPSRPSQSLGGGRATVHRLVGAKSEQTPVASWSHMYGSSIQVIGS